MSDFSDGYIYVDYSQMSNAADDMITQTRAIATTLSNLEMELNELKNTWIGDDKDVYAQKQQAWDNAVKAMEELLTKHSTLLTSVSENYQYSEQSLTQMWDSVKIGR
ncbi:WXG100 family type VII secretion target [Streptomyces canus]|jgi:WXG100 family type VII secretion target|uniref:WXG100 family type VII secretion target n=1 Tax=unclassified Streptomyces TaxID=2593676 RepID=UPI000F64EF70|nr:WXG100 family type VII secretion target [Streptomyces sp. RP5T]RRR77780.1 WXG100 family type VII secretion target [Streptomyces sp. RP5T]